MNQSVPLPEPRPIEWPPPSPALILKRARTAAEEILAAAEAEAAKLRTESASLRAEVETAANEAERRKQKTVDEHRRVTALLDEEVEAGRQTVRLSQERAAQLTEEADQALANARREANRLLAKAQKQADDAAALLAAAVPRGQAEADRQLAVARKEADTIIARANTNAEVIVDSARDEERRLRHKAQQYRAQLREQEDVKTRRNRWINDWSPRVALSATVVLTASGETSLAVLTGWPQTIAWALPVAIDIYVVQAIRRHRDVMAAIVLMVVANATYHLAAAGLLGVHSDAHGKLRPEWWLIAAVAAIAPWVMLRIHHITGSEKERKRRQKAAICTGPTGVLTLRRPESLAPVVAISRAVSASTTPPAAAASGARKALLSGDNSAAKKRQDELLSGAADGARKPANKGDELATTRRRRGARAGAKKTTPARRSLDEWVEVAAPVFHSEFARLRRNPTANEFATAIAKAGHGTVSDSTAKNIRAEILDRTELPTLD